MQKPERQLIGTAMDLQEHSPLNMEQEAGNTKSPTKQFYGTEAPITRNRTDQVPLNDGAGSVSKQLIGTDIELDKTPHHGYESWDTPMSKQNIKQSR